MSGLLAGLLLGIPLGAWLSWEIRLYSRVNRRGGTLDLTGRPPW